MRFALLLCLPLLVLGATPVEAKDKGPSPEDVHAAIQRGAEFLTTRFADGFDGTKWHDPVELVVLTMAHAHVDRQNDVFQKGLKKILEVELQYTYRVATMAMALSHLNPFLYRERLAYCAQWLVDTQLPGGEWGYPGGVGGGRTIDAKAIGVHPPTVEPHDGKGKPPPIVITRRTGGTHFEGQKGDFSNTQFAILGLKACLDARIEIPKETWQKALDYMAKFQQEDGSWGYVMQGEQDDSGYASLTSAGVCGAAICLYGTGKKNPKSAPIVKKGVSWLAKNWDATRNASIDESAIIGPSGWQYYNLYSVERVGSILNTKKIGKQKWYPVGASWLLSHQRSDGSWADPEADIQRSKYLHTADTCFAILFLARATPPLTGS